MQGKKERLTRRRFLATSATLSAGALLPGALAAEAAKDKAAKTTEMPRRCILRSAWIELSRRRSHVGVFFPAPATFSTALVSRSIRRRMISRTRRISAGICTH